MAGLTAFSFGIEDVDRHSVIYKKDAVPCEEELEALRKGEAYDPQMVRLRKLAVRTTSPSCRLSSILHYRSQEEEEKRERLSKPKKSQIVPNSNFMEKYEHLVGKDAGKDAAQVMTANKQFGFGEIRKLQIDCHIASCNCFSVSSENKRDQRSIEQTLADISKKKKQKVETETRGPEEASTSQLS